MYQLRIKYFLILFLAYLILNTGYFIPVAEGHLLGQPPFFKINGAYSQLYFVPLTSLSNFDLPQDGAPGNYLVNQPINFEFDVNRLPAPPDIVKKTQFTWDFGDGSKGEGLSTTHIYTKMGSYILKIYAFDGTTPAPQLIESVLINALPNQNYQLPKASISVNNTESSDPLTDILKFPLGQSLTFDSSKSSGGSSPIISYFWDFGDQESSTQVKVNHYYPGDLTQVFPMLRVKTADGFLSDNFVEIENANNSTNLLKSPPPRPTATGSQLPLVLGIVGACLLIFTALRFVRSHGGKR